MGRTEFAETGFTQETNVLGPKHLTHSHLVDAMMYGRQKTQPEIGFQSGSSMPSLWYSLAVVSATICEKLGFGSVVQHLPYMCGALGPIPSTPYSPATFESLISMYDVCNDVYNGPFASWKQIINNKP